MTDTMFEIGENITHDTAKAALKQGLQHIAAGATQVSCRTLASFDSSALAVLLAWRRAAAQRGQGLHVTQVPTSLASLAWAYGVDALAFGEQAA